jgi:hypothetical protein
MLKQDVTDYHNIDDLVSDINNASSALQAAYGSAENIAAHYAVDAAKSDGGGLDDAETQDDIKETLQAHLDVLYFDADADFNRDAALKLALELV